MACCRENSLKLLVSVLDLPVFIAFVGTIEHTEIRGYNTANVSLIFPTLVVHVRIEHMKKGFCTYILLNEIISECS